MGDINGFRKFQREDPSCEAVASRVKHFDEFTEALSEDSLRRQGARCMDCGVPFCHQGCPLGNVIPEWNHLSSQSQWQEALKVLHSTNNFPEFTGRVCPAPCESACVLGINEDPVSIEAIEMALADKGFERGWVTPQPPAIKTGKSVAIVGSGPAGLAAAQQLNRLGHQVVVYEKDDRPGGLLMYGIPDFKLSKATVMRRVQQLKDEGVLFKFGVNVGVTLDFSQLKQNTDAILLACGAGKTRDLDVKGRHGHGIYFADTLLRQSTRLHLGDYISDSHRVTAHDKDVIVIGGGDTGSDCVGVSNRQGAKSINQFEILHRPPDLGKFPRGYQRPESTPWPQWPLVLRTSSSHQEGVERHWCLQTKEFLLNQDGHVKALVTEKVIWHPDHSLEVVPDSTQRWPCDLAVLAIGFTGAETEGLVEQAGISLKMGKVDANESSYMTKDQGIFAAGDMRRGQSLVVWAIHEGRQAAASIHRFLMS